MRFWWRTWKAKKYIDQTTGDTLTFGEEVSWFLQGIIRRWVVFILITLFTAWCWLAGHIWAQSLTTVWNLFASYWAMALETIVGIAMFSSTKRDAILIRKIMKMEEQNNQVIRHLEELLNTPTIRMDEALVGDAKELVAQVFPQSSLLHPLDQRQ